jgi:hypothetical protein
MPDISKFWMIFIEKKKRCGGDSFVAPVFLYLQVWKQKSDLSMIRIYGKLPEP